MTPFDPAADALPALPLEVAASDALELAEDALIGIHTGTTCYTDVAACLEEIATLLRCGLGE